MRVIHSDLKTSNVLLDMDLNHKISYFGLATIFGADQIEANTGRIVGTPGYMSPEFASQGLFSEKSDVFNFGVILREIITGKEAQASIRKRNLHRIRMADVGRRQSLGASGSINGREFIST